MTNRNFLQLLLLLVVVFLVPSAHAANPRDVDATSFGDSVASGELYGFERTRATSMRAAQEIASEARAFGQEDDFTVLTVTLSPVAAMA